MPRCYLTLDELSEITGISTNDINDLISQSKIVSYESEKYKKLFPLTVLNQLRDLNYKNIPDIVPYGRTGYNAVNYDAWWANDGEYEVCLDPDQKIPKGYIPGRLLRKEEVKNESVSVQEVSATSGNQDGS